MKKIENVKLKLSLNNLNMILEGIQQLYTVPSLVFANKLIDFEMEITEYRNKIEKDNEENIKKILTAEKKMKEEFSPKAEAIKKKYALKDEVGLPYLQEAGNGQKAYVYPEGEEGAKIIETITQELAELEKGFLEEKEILNELTKEVNQTEHEFTLKKTMVDSDMPSCFSINNIISFRKFVDTNTFISLKNQQLARDKQLAEAPIEREAASELKQIPATELK